MYKAADILLKTLTKLGVDTVFGYPGSSVLPIYDRIPDYPIRHILTAHEQGASFAASGYARATGKTGVVIATSGPGATNLVTGIADAFMDSVPLVAITGNVKLSDLGHDCFQEVDIFGIIRDRPFLSFLPAATTTAVSLMLAVPFGRISI